MKLCKFCNKSFTSVENARLYCSKRCKLEYVKRRNSIRWRLRHPLRTCKACGQVLSSNAKTYCCVECTPAFIGRLEYAKDYHQKHKKERAKKAKEKWGTSKYKQCAKNSALKRKYGITLIEYHKMLEEQKGVCKICGKPSTAKDRYGGVKKLHVDHNHKTGEIRGLLCVKCNQAIGLFGESKEVLQNAIFYLFPMERAR